MSETIEVTTTTESKEQASELARLLVENRLAACVQVAGPIQSTYRWNGEICCGEEFRCTAKSTKTLLGEITEFIQRWHPYDVPEILVSEVTSSSQAYATWILQQLES